MNPFTVVSKPAFVVVSIEFPALASGIEKFPVRRDVSFMRASILVDAVFATDDSEFSTPTTTNPPAAPAATPCACMDENNPFVAFSFVEGDEEEEEDEAEEEEEGTDDSSVVA